MSKLTEIMDKRCRERVKSPEGLDQLLDLTALEKVEFYIFCRKQSMLMHKIDQVLSSRSPEDEVKAMIAMIGKQLCPKCGTVIRFFTTHDKVFARSQCECK